MKRSGDLNVTEYVTRLAPADVELRSRLASLTAVVGANTKWSGIGAGSEEVRKMTVFRPAVAGFMTS
jgi:hypothetical protein